MFSFYTLSFLDHIAYIIRFPNDAQITAMKNYCQQNAEKQNGRRCETSSPTAKTIAWRHQFCWL